MIKPVIYPALLLATLLASSCSKSIFDNDDTRCPFVERGGCQSMEMVNRMVTERRFTPDGQFVQQAGRRQSTSPYK